MSGLDAAEYDFLGALFSAQTVDEFERLVVPFCSSAFSAQSVLVVLYHRTGMPEVSFRWIPDTTLQTTFDRNYCKFGYLLDPFYKLALETDDWTACTLWEIAPDRFEVSGYNSGYFNATGMVDELGLVVRIDEDNAIHFSLGRNFGNRRFRAREVSKFCSLSKVLVPALKSVLIRPTSNIHNAGSTLEHQFLGLSGQQGKEISIRESEVASLIVQGHSSRAIGLKLGISTHTVKVHRRNLYKKLNISSQSELFGLLTASFEQSLETIPNSASMD